ncbi:MAG: hypothetical protein KDD89_00985 [Anaerolineales bacterium]|nr:hypothetical protein [Anaerolineales bacterium]
MNNNVALWIGIVAAGLAAVVYYVVLPHLEGPSLDEQQPHRKSWLVKCPQCGLWAEHTPVSSTFNEAVQGGEASYTNWYRCEACQQRWQETYRR